MLRPLTAAVLAISALALPTLSANAQCIPHVADEYAPANISGTAYCSAFFDDGSGTGPCLFAGGELWVDSTRCLVAKLVDGRWVPLQLPGIGFVRALSIMDDGSGPALYAGGRLDYMGNVSKWNGSTWTSVPIAGTYTVESLAQFPPTPGGGMYAATDSSTNQLLRLNGAAWEPVPSAIGGRINTLKVLDDGTGSKLYIGGTFGTAGGQPARGIATWDGALCQPVGTGLLNLPQSYVSSIALHDDGSGPKIYIAGKIYLSSTSPSQVAALVGNTWIPRLTEANTNYQEATGLASHTDEQGPALYVATGYRKDLAKRVRALRGGVWSDAGPEFEGPTVAPVMYPGIVHSLDTHPTPSGTTLIAVGGIIKNGALTTATVATLTNNLWLNAQPKSQVPSASPIFSDPGENTGELYLFRDAMHTPQGWVRTSLPVNSTWGGVRANIDGESCFVIHTTSGLRVKRSTGWTSLPAPLGMRGVVAVDLGSGPELYTFHTDSSMSNIVLSKYTNAAWTQVGPALFPVTSTNNALFALDTGSGRRLHVLHQAPAGSPNPIFEFDGAAWPQVAAIDGTLTGLTTFDLGDGPELIIAGDLPPDGPTQFHGLARWNGTRLAPLPDDLGFDVGRVVTTIQTHTGPQLWAGGRGGETYGYWNGSTWVRPYPIAYTLPLARPLEVSWFVPVNNPDGSQSIFLTGTFSEFAGMPASNFAEIITCAPSCTPDFNSDGDSGTDADIEAFFACLAGNCCPTCATADFNNDGDFGNDTDIESFFRVLAGGPC